MSRERRASVPQPGMDSGVIPRNMVSMSDNQRNLDEENRWVIPQVTTSTRPSTAVRPTRSARRPSSWPTWSPSTGRRSSRTRSPCSTPTRRRAGTARSSAGPTCPPAETSCTTSGGTRAAARSRTPGTTPTGLWSAAPLPAAARAAVLQHPRLRHPPGPPAAQAGPDDQRGRTGRGGGLLPPAHPALRPGRDLRVLPRRRELRRGPGRHRAARSRHLRRAARLGDRPRTAVPGLRRLVAPEPEHADHQRVGHAVDDRGRDQPRAAAQPQVRSRAAFLGPGGGQAPADGRPRRAVPDGPGAAPVARPRADLGLRRRGGQHRRPVRLGVAVEPPGRAAGAPTR